MAQGVRDYYNTPPQIYYNVISVKRGGQINMHKQIILKTTKMF